MRVKICGLRTLADVDAAVQAGATAVGFVFDTSIRQLTPAQARPLIDRVPRGVEALAVFRRADPELLLRVLDLGVDGVQAEEEPAGLQRAGVFFLRAVLDGPELLARVGQPSKGTLVTGSLRGCVLIDGPAGPGQGVRADLERVAEVAAVHPVVLAGGLTPDNVGAAIRATRAVGVDVSSGVESAPGVKDPARMLAFVRAVKEAR